MNQHDSKNEISKGHITLRYLQRYIAAKDHSRDDPAHSPRDTFVKLTEELGELARHVVRTPRHAADENDLKGSVEEEIYDVLYYLLLFAADEGVDVEKWIPLKEQINRTRYPSGVNFDPDGETL